MVDLENLNQKTLIGGGGRNGRNWPTSVGLNGPYVVGITVHAFSLLEIDLKCEAIGKYKQCYKWCIR